MSASFKTALAVSSIIAVIWLGEHSICRSVSCLRNLVSVDQNICFWETDSVGLVVTRDNGALTKVYFAFRDMIFPSEHTVVWNEDQKVIAFLEPGDLFPLQKDPPPGESCTIIR